MRVRIVKGKMSFFLNIFLENIVNFLDFSIIKHIEISLHE